MHGIKLGKLAVVVVGQKSHEFLLGLFTQVFCVHEKQDALRLSMLDQPVDAGDGGKGLAGTGCHLYQGAGFVLLEGGFQIVNGGNLAGAQAFGV